MIRKRCLRPQCGRIYKEKDEGFSSDCCKICGALLELLEDEEVVEDVEDVEDVEEFMDSTIEDNSLEKTKELDEEKYNEISEDSVNLSNDDFFFIDEQGYIHFKDINTYKEELNCDRLVIYKNSQVFKVVPLVYDETIIGRSNSKFNVDVDLSDIDHDKTISRKHAMIYKSNDKFFVRNLSTKNSLHVNSQSLIGEDTHKLNSNDLIILSRLVVIEYVSKEFKEEVEAHVEDREI